MGIQTVIVSSSKSFEDAYKAENHLILYASSKSKLVFLSFKNSN